MRIVDKPSSRLFYQGYTSGDDSEIAALFEAKFGRKPTEIVRSLSAGSVLRAGPVLDKQLGEMKKPHPKQKAIDELSVSILQETAKGGRR